MPDESNRNPIKAFIGFVRCAACGSELEQLTTPNAIRHTGDDFCPACGGLGCIEVVEAQVKDDDTATNES